MTNLPVADALIEAAQKKINEVGGPPDTDQPDDKKDAYADSDTSDPKEKDKKSKKGEKIIINPELRPAGSNNPGGSNNAGDITGNTRLQTV